MDPSSNRIRLAIGSLHVSAGLHLLLGLVMAAMFFVGDRFGLGLLIGLGIVGFSFGMALAVEVVAYGLHQRKFWAWCVALVVFLQHLTSCALPLGVLGLWGLLDDDSRAEFGVNKFFGFPERLGFPQGREREET